MAGSVAGPAAGPVAGSAAARPIDVRADAGDKLRLYTADRSSGLNDWAGDSSWKTLRGPLLSDGSGRDANIFAPCGAITDCAVEARVRAIKPDSFGIVFRHPATEEGNVAVVEEGYR